MSENPNNPQSQSQSGAQGGKQNPLARVLSAIKAPFGKKS